MFFRGGVGGRGDLGNEVDDYPQHERSMDEMHKATCVESLLFDDGLAANKGPDSGRRVHARKQLPGSLVQAFEQLLEHRASEKWTYISRWARACEWKELQIDIGDLEIANLFQWL